MKRFRMYGLALVAMMAGALAMAACTATSSGPETTTAQKGTKPYGSLKVGLESWGLTDNVLDPTIISHAGYAYYGAVIFDSLVEMGPNGEPRPGIAERWEIAPDGRTQTFYIRKGVKFHNGDDLTGADVRFSMERMMGTDATHTYATNWRSSIARVELKDEYTVVIHLKEPRFELPDGTLDLSGVSSVVPKKYIEEKGVEYFRQHPVGSGPWKFVSRELGSRLEFEAVESHWRTVPQFKNLTILKVANESTMVAMLKTGELDMGAITPDAAAGLKAAGMGMADWDTGSGIVAYMWYDLDNPANSALGDVRVRKALSLAVNRQELADHLMRGYAKPSIPLYAAPEYAFFFDSNVLKMDPYDPEQAKRLIAEAGRPRDFKLKVWDRQQGTLETQMIEALAGYWRKAGINAEVASVDYASVLVPMFRPVVKPELYDSLFVAKNSGTAGLFDKVALGFHSKKSSIKNTRSPKLDELIDKVPTVLDPVEKKRIALEAARLALNEYTSIAYIWIRPLVALGPKVGTIAPFKGVSGLALSFETATHAK